MGRRKSTVTYTVKDIPGITITVPGKGDDEKTRAAALDEAMRLMDEGEISNDSFQDGLGVNDLIFVEASSLAPPKSEGTREDSPLEQAARTVAELTLKRVALQTQQREASQYLELIEAVFSMKPLTEEQIELAKDKNFPKSLVSLAQAKVEFDELFPEAEKAWELLKPALTDPAKLPSNGKGAAAEKTASKK